MKIRLCLLALAVFLPACNPTPKPAAESVSVQVEKRPDGLFYAKGTAEPLSGEVVGFTGSNTRQSVETYEKGRPHGIWKRYWTGGALKREQTWHEGEQIHQRQWYENGTMKEDLQMKQGIGYGQIRLWWPDGRIRRMAFVGDKLQPHGHVLEYAEDGTVLVDAIFHHGEFVSGLRKEDPLAKGTTAQAH
jgi:antitoxin component YwqK of YwqJK toxin-antitoxin module